VERGTFRAVFELLDTRDKPSGFALVARNTVGAYLRASQGASAPDPAEMAGHERPWRGVGVRRELWGRVLVSGSMSEAPSAPRQSAVQCHIIQELARRSLVHVTQRYAGRPWFAVCVAGRMVSGRVDHSWSTAERPDARPAPSYAPAPLPRSVAAALLDSAALLGLDIVELRLLERDDGAWLCYSASAWPRLSEMQWAADDVADHLLVHLQGVMAR
jgi:hypothetical protein